MPSEISRGQGADALETAARLTESLLEWQAVGEPECFARIVEIVSPMVLHIAARALLRSGLRSHSLRDDVLSLVLDHLRRLHARATFAHQVARFAPEPDGSAATGRRYVGWLALSRARDVIRRERRRRMRQPSFTDLSLASPGELSRSGCPPPSPPDDSEQFESLRAAIDVLDSNARLVVEMLLAGRSQKQIAETLGVCEGTVSRRKDRAFLRIRDFMLAKAPQDQAGGASDRSC